MLFWYVVALSLFFLIGTFSLTLFIMALRNSPYKEVIRQLDNAGKRFFYRRFHLRFFPKQEFDTLSFAVLCALTVCRFLYAASSLSLLTFTGWFWQIASEKNSELIHLQPLSWLWMFLSLLGLILVAFVLADYVPRILGTRFPEKTLAISPVLASIFLFLAFPFTYLFLRLFPGLAQMLSPNSVLKRLSRADLLELLHNKESGSAPNPLEQKLVESVLAFRERIAREVMVPRVDVFALPSDTPIKTAVPLLQEQGYSRTPVYQQTIDNIVGVLMYKDILAKYMEYERENHSSAILDAPIETLMKPVLHTPETKSLFSLLQEFRKKQVHLAIVVDEYGGTEGIVTIEDILEEIVGDIADEYDDKELLFHSPMEGSWIVDARLTLWDAEEELGVNIPQDGEYDTIGGYIFHTTGTIPPKGFVIHQDQFDMEILESNDRCVEKVRINKRKA